MGTLDLAKRRARLRRDESGAAMFVVAMTLAVLASVGIYALAAAAMEVRTSGNERQNSQTHYLAEYGVIGTSYELTSMRAQWYLGVMLTAPDTPCLSLPVPATADNMARACRRLGSAEIGLTQTGSAWSTHITETYGGTVPLQSGAPPGSFGPVPMNGDFFVELTEPLQSSAPTRYALDLHLCFINFTATSTGLTQPVYVGAPDGTAQFGGEGTETQRARLVAGPITCPH